MRRGQAFEPPAAGDTRTPSPSARDAIDVRRMTADDLACRLMGAAGRGLGHLLRVIPWRR